MVYKKRLIDHHTCVCMTKLVFRHFSGVCRTDSIFVGNVQKFVDDKFPNDFKGAERIILFFVMQILEIKWRISQKRLD